MAPRRKRASQDDAPTDAAAAALARIARSRQQAQAIEKELRESSPLLSDLAFLLLGQTAFDKAMAEKPELKELLVTLNMVLKHQEQALAERRLEMVGGKSGQTGPASRRAGRKGGLSPETLQKIEEMAKIL